MEASPARLYYGWIVVAATFLVLFVVAGVQSAPPVLLRPLEQDLRLDRGSISAVLSLGALLNGLTCPVAGGLYARFGLRRLALGGLTLTGISTGVGAIVTAPWQFAALWALVGIGTGLASAVLGMAVADRWFPEHRGLVLGILSAAGSAGQLVVVPLLMRLMIAAGWRVGLAVLAGSVVSAIAVAAAVLRDVPGALGGCQRSQITPAASAPSLADSARSLGAPVAGPQAFWLLAGGFSVCGATASGLIGTHLIAHSVEHGLPELAAADLVAILAAANAIGAAVAGWLTDRYDPRSLLAICYLARGGSLLALPFVDGLPGLIAFCVVFGLDSTATTPPIAVLVSRAFGRERAGVVFGWLLCIHQFGAALGGSVGGGLHAAFGDYRIAFLAGGVFALVATVMTLRFSSTTASPRTPRPLPAHVGNAPTTTSARLPKSLHAPSGGG